MQLIEIEGNLLESKVNVIAHQTNCKATMGSGIARQIRDKWVNVYQAYCDLCLAGGSKLLGTCQMVKIGEKQYVANLFGQDGYGIEKRQTDYEQIYRALEDLASIMRSKELTSVAFPCYMSSALAGADWHIIKQMIISVFDNTPFRVEIIKWNKN
jgi:O-acetyl-ADP-ribose deacetylase (regulator of RNase III)